MPSYKEIINHYVNWIKQYSDFKWKATREEFWLFVLVNIILTIIFLLVDEIIQVNIVSTVYFLFILIPSLSISIRRLHDIWKSRYRILISLIPIIWIIWLIVLWSLPSVDLDKNNESAKDNNIQN